jgi:predicted O-methyltransferase YrrM
VYNIKYHRRENHEAYENIGYLLALYLEKLGYGGRGRMLSDLAPTAALLTIGRLLKKSIRHPARAVSGAIAELKLARLDRGHERQRLLAFLADHYGANTTAINEEYFESDFVAWCRTRREELARFPGPYRFGSTPEFDCESLYLLVRSLKPRVVVETGVCYGASSAYILEALDRNGTGELYSIDLGNDPQEPPNHFFVPRRLRNCWHLIIGDSRRKLPPLLKRLGKIDLFHHDSLHTFGHMMWEYQTAIRHLDQAGALSSHDVINVLSLRQPWQRSPFTIFCEHHGLRFEIVYNFGVAVRPK